VNEALRVAAAEGALILVGPGVLADIPADVPQRHVPAGMLLPLAEGARLADPSRPVVAVGGDGDIYGEQLGDLLHAVRRNTGVTCFVTDNGVAGPHLATVGAGEFPLKPLALALAAGSSFVAQVLPGATVEGLAEEALHHPGFALVNIRTERGRVDGINLDGEEGYDRFSRDAALQRATDLEHFYTGVLFREPERELFEHVLLGQAPLVTTVSTIDWDEWERIAFGEWGEEGDEDEPDTDGAWA
jgi:hypothetical protein